MCPKKSFFNEVATSVARVRYTLKDSAFRDICYEISTIDTFSFSLLNWSLFRVLFYQNKNIVLKSNDVLVSCRPSFVTQLRNRLENSIFIDFFSQFAPAAQMVFDLGGRLDLQITNDAISLTIPNEKWFMFHNNQRLEEELLELVHEFSKSL